MAIIAIGDLLDGKYKVRRRLGGGGFGEVFLATDEGLKARPVAIKVLNRPNDGKNDDLVWEMEALAKFHHAHVVAFHHHFTADNRLFLVMEFCPGGSLDDRLTAETKLTEQQVFAWGLDLCDTLAFVHGKGIVHHDIKPQNILFAADGTIKLGDFGVANRNTGTVMYMSPEQLLGEPVAKDDPRVDVYALGITLLETLTGQHPFEATSMDRADQCRARIQHDFVSPDLPRWAQEVLLTATHPTPELRFQTAADFADAIRGKHVPYLFDGNRLHADVLAQKAAKALGTRKWLTAEKLAKNALEMSEDSVSALLAAGRANLLMRRIDRAGEYFLRALRVSPRTPVQKELGWISLEQGHFPTAISLLTDHLQRNASDYEAYNLLLKCFYLTDRFEPGLELANTIVAQKAPESCFVNNRFLFRLMNGELNGEDIALSKRERANPFFVYNHTVLTEEPRSWGDDKAPWLKSKLMFQEFGFGTAKRAGKANTVRITTLDDKRHDFKKRIVTLGSLAANDIAIKDVSVSRRHAVIINYPDNVWLYDLDTTVGTFSDGQRLSGRMFLDGMHDVSIGRVRLRIASSSDRLL